MKKVFLYHEGKIQHYRIGVYNYLHGYLKKHGYNLTVVSEGYQTGCNMPIEFPNIKLSFSFFSLTKSVRCNQPWVNIIFMHIRKRYYFPFLLYLRITGNKVVAWTHGVNLQKKGNKISSIAHHISNALCHRIILYSEDMKKYLLKRHLTKSYVANNTLNLKDYIPRRENRNEILRRYNITTKKNIVYSGRIDIRKRIIDLMKAFELIDSKDVGLIIIGPEENSVIEEKYKKHPRIYYLGPLYGEVVLDILSASDICCIPGAVGLGIVDSMYCGLPLITEAVDHGPEIMYFKNETNGFMVPKGDVAALAEKLKILLSDDVLRSKLGNNARQEILSKGQIDNLCSGFLSCLVSLDKEDDMSSIKG